MPEPGHSAKQKNIFFAECPDGATRQIFSKNKFFVELCQVPPAGHSAKKIIFFKKIAKCLQSGTRQLDALSKDFFKTKLFSLLSALLEALGKAVVNDGTPVTVPFLCLCRVPDICHLAKMSLPTNFLLNGLCRVRHSAKPLPSA